MNVRQFSVLLTSIAILSLLFTSFAIANTNAGQTFTVTAITDVVDYLPGDGVCETASGNGMCTLRAAIMEANALIGADTIILPEADYELTIPGAGEDESATGDLDITESLTIQGPAYDNAYSSIDATGLGDRVLHVLASVEEVSISKVHISGGQTASSAGGILNQGRLELTDVWVMTNDAGLDGGGIYSSHTLILTNVTLYQNTAASEGGGLYSSGVLDVKNCSFNDNTADEDGGGAHITSITAQRILNSEFKYNSSAFGGGIYNRTTLTLESSSIYSNAATHGGGIYNTGSLTMHDLWIYQNTAEVAGGGIYGNEGSLVIQDASIYENTAGSSSGGGIYSQGGEDITLEKVSIYDNSANDGGGMYVSSGNLHGHSALFDQNAATSGGGAAFIHSGNVDFDQSTFSNNSAALGGALYSDWQGHIALTDSTIISNTATAEGGGLLNAYYLDLFRVTISDNEAETGAGIHNDADGMLSVENSTISGNTAELNGGGIHNEGIAYVYHSTLTGNAASADPISPSGSGGGVFNVDGAGFYIWDTILYGNYRRGIFLEDNDCYGTLTTKHYNLLGTLDDCTLGDDQGLDLIGLDPLLGALADNGGLTLTRALSAGSPAIDAANPAGCMGKYGLLTTDQRGHPLPWDGDADGTAHCDIGAFEAPLTIVYLPMTVK